MGFNISSKIIDFLKKRLKELLGVIFIITSIFLIISLITYSPSDPNFLFSEKIPINNLFGFYGSVASDLLFQSIGMISFLITFNLFFWGLGTFKKETNYLALKIFFSIIYILTGTTAISIFKNESFWLIANGNGGFVGNLIKKFTLNYINSEHDYYLLIFLTIITIIFFFLSSNFKIRSFNLLFRVLSNLCIKLISLFFRKKNNQNIVDEDKDIVDESKFSAIKISEQPDLPFRSEVKKNIYNLKYKLPPLNFLKEKKIKDLKKNNSEEFSKNSEFLEKILLDFGVEGKIKKISHGPVVTLFEFEPAPGIRVSRIINLSDDIARNTSSLSTRVATIPGKNTIGIEIPNQERDSVFLSEIISDEKFKKKEINLPIALGKSISGIPIVGDLTAMPHLLIAGTTGSGKSVCINTVILSLLYKLSPEKCKFILIDPKMLELSTYEGIPHLLCPVITEARKATSALGWVVKEMERRYKKMTSLGVRNIDGYNVKNKDILPYIVVIVDEMSDLMLVAGKEIENYIQKLSQMARAAGIHIIMATQRPSVDVITGTIKANFPTRISFQVSSKIDSRTILGEQGAEQLLGKGDMLFMSSANRIVRIHGPYVSEEEIEKVNSHIRSQGQPKYIEEIISYDSYNDQNNSNLEDDSKDELYLNAVKLVKSEGKASTSFLQRKLQIGYNRAARIIDMMEKEGIVGKANHVGKREILKV